VLEKRGRDQTYCAGPRCRCRHLILIGVLFILPMIGAQIGLDLNVVSQSIAAVTGAVIGIILWITGHT
jgi:uncharacterized membrane protein